MTARKNTLASKLLMAVLSVALVFTMMPLSMGFAFAADETDYQPALTITGPDGTVTTYQTREDVIDAFTAGTDTSIIEGTTLTGIYVKKLLSGYADDAVVTVQTQDNYTGTLNANGKTVAELKALKGILAYQENDTVYDPTLEEYGGYFILYLGSKNDSGKPIKDKWVNRITITDAGGVEPPQPTSGVLTTSGDVVSPLAFEGIKDLKNWARDNNLVVNTTFNTTNSAGTDEAFEVEGVTVESLIAASGLETGKKLDSLKVVADASTSPYEKTFAAEKILNQDLDGNKAMFIWSELSKNAPEGTAPSKVQKFAIGKFAPEDINRSQWVRADVSMDLAVTAATIPILSVSGDVAAPQEYVDVKALKNWARDNNLVVDATFNTTNAAGTDETFAVQGVTVESLLAAAGLQEGMELDSLKVVADASTRPYEKTFTADQILNQDLDGNKAMFIWSEQKISDPADPSASKVQKFAIGKFKPEDMNRGQWVRADVSMDLQVTAKAKILPPGKVTITKAKPGKRYVKLAWKKVSGASGYVVYKATKKSGKYKAVKTTKSLKYTVKKLKKGKVYYFKVRAYKNTDKGKLWGSYSKIKKARAK